MKYAQEENFELSVNQKRFWFLNKDNFKQLHTQLSIKFLNQIHVEKLTNILNRITDTHETLSSKLMLDKSSIFPYQTPSYYKRASIEILSDDLYPAWKTNQENRINDLGLETILPIQFFIFSDIQGNVTRLVYRIYSFWTDLYGSFKILDNISAVIANIELPIPDNEGFITHKNFAAWQNELIVEKDNKGLDFWSNYLCNPGKKIIPFGGKLISAFQPQKINLFEIQEEQFSLLSEFIDKKQISIELHFLASVIYFMRNYEESALTLGYTMFGRIYEVLNETIGLISKTVPLEIDESFDINNKESLEKLIDSIEKVKDWSDYYGANSFDDDAEKLKFKVCFQYIDVNLAFQNPRTPYYVIEDIFNTQETFEIKLAVTNFGDRLTMELYYDVNTFTDVEITVIKDQLMDSLRKIINGSYFPVKNSDVIPSILNKLTGYDVNNIDLDTSILDLIQKQVQIHPNSIAIQSESNQITYYELWEKTNSLANCLVKEYGPVKEKPIAILLYNPVDYIISILGILKTGAFFVPLDSFNPESRINFVLADCNCVVLITEKSFESKIDFSGRFCFYEQVSKLTADDDSKVSSETAYVIYTSGSSGFPKGVMVSHRSLINYILWAKEYYLEPKDLGNSGLFTSFSFDLTLTSIFVPLANGKIIFVQKEDLSVDERLIRIFENPKIDLIKLTPAHINLLSILDFEVKGAKIIICGGESLTIHQVQLLYKLIPNVRIYNEYGPTEATIGCIVKQINQEDKRILIGRPISNTKIKIVGKNGDCSVGTIGEILIGGECLSMGYLNNPEETKLSFFLLDGQSENLFYKSGDLGRILPSGELEYIGRKDSQIKIRGYRVELEEIEYHIKNHSEISDAVVIYKKNEFSEGELVAFIVSKKNLLSSELRDFLKFVLPDYMIPQHFFMIEKVPLTSNGKLDRKSLLDSKGLELTIRVVYVAPRNKLEEELVKIWEEVLQRDNIGVKDDFFSLGGHSLKAVRLSNEYGKKQGVKLSLKDLLAHTSIEQHAEIIRSSKKEVFKQIEKVAQQESYPISDAQRRLWVLSQFEGGSVAYNIPGNVYLNQDIDIESFKRGIEWVIDRHEILRTVFKEDEKGEIRQWILKKEDLNFKIEYIDYRKEKDKDKDKKVKNYIAEDSHKAFDLVNGPLLRASLLQVEEESYIFYYNMHHIISDGWSMEVLRKCVFSYYEAYKENKPPELKPLRIQYKDYSAWQLSQLEEESFKAHRVYWLDSLKGELPLLDLPSTKPRPRIKTHNGHVLSAYIDRSTTVKLKRYSQDNGGSLFIGLLASWTIMMYRYSGQKDVIIGTPVAGREHSDLEDQIGFYVNTLALKNEIDPEENVNSFYKRLKEHTLKSYSHQMYPFDRLVEELDLQRDTSRSAVFDVMLMLQNNGERVERVEIQEEELNQLRDQGYRASKFDVEISVQEVGDYLSLDVTYNPDVYERAMVEDLIHHYKQLLNVVLESPEEKVSQIDYLSEEEKQELLVTFNDTEIEYPRDKTIVDLFEEQVEKTPDNIAIVFEEKELRYKELDAKSNQLADYLQKNYKIKADDLVGIKLERNEWMIISILGVLKSGGAYVPIDPAYPQERIDYIEKDTKCKVCIDEKELTTFKKSQKKHSKKKIISRIKPDNLAYVIYTSGSTGMPKGVMIEHHSLVSFMSNFDSAFGLGKVQKIAGTTNLTFDICGLEIWGTLCHGKELVLLSQEELNDPDKFLEKIEKSKVEGLQLTPSRLSQIYSIKSGLPKSISCVLIGGEELSEPLYEGLKKAAFESINVYGPTETTIWSTSLNLCESERLSIGNPLSNEQVYLLSEEEELQPIGLVGEICIGGNGLARGYLNQEELTKEKFIANPFKEGERLYKTGDLGRWLADGNIEFIGRKDDQVKIRGYRIELGEIEYALLKHEQIEEAVVVARENQNKEKELVAYITSDEEQNIPELRSYLKEILPEYMIPSYYVQLESLPLTSNGKVNRKVLPDPQGLGLPSRVEYVAPRNEIEEKLVRIWEEVLQRDNIGVKDDFFFLGGNSIKVIRIISKIQKEYDIKVEVAKIFEASTIEEIADFISIVSWNYSSIDSKMDEFKI